MPNYYCKNCGGKYPTVSSLTSSYCPRHPEGANKGKHELYQGNEKNQYCCQYCGVNYPTIQSMTANFCPRHPKGANKGKHAPAL